MFISRLWVCLVVATLAQALEPLLHSAILDQHGEFVLRWTPEDDFIILEMEAQTQGYLAVGFSPNGGMKDSDIYIGWIDEEGKPNLSDRHAIGQSSPIVDDLSDAELLWAQRNNTHTTIRFRRPWVTCDKKQDREISSDTTRVIWALNEWPLSFPSDDLPYHTKRGVRSMYLKEPKAVPPSSADDMQYWDILAPNVSMTEGLPTLYWCSLHKVKNFTEKNHFIGYKPLIDSKSLKYVHHMLLYECSLKDSSVYLDQWVGHRGAQCYSQNMPLSWQSCSDPIITWATGSEGGNFPPDVGFPLGEVHDGSNYFMLEVHYNNPDLDVGLVDISGLRLYHTNKLRKYDAGMLRFGHDVDPFQIIGPGTNDWTTVAHCSSDCTSKMIPSSGIKLFSGLLHSHLLGRAITLQHIRGNKELEPFLEDFTYDFNYQQERFFEREKTVLPGDHFITSCHYDTKNKSKPIFGGFSTDEEMCLAFLMYYPRIKFTACLSRPDISGINNALGIEELYDQQELVKSFGSAQMNLNPEEEAKLREELATKQAGEGGVDILLSTTFSNHIIKTPQALHGKNLLEVLMDSSLWSNSTIFNNLQDLLIHGNFQQKCQSVGNEFVTLDNLVESSPVFESFTPVQKPCLGNILPDSSAGSMTEEEPTSTVPPLVKQVPHSSGALSEEKPTSAGVLAKEEPTTSAGVLAIEEPTSASSLADDLPANAWILAEGVPPSGGTVAEDLPTSADSLAEEVRTSEGAPAKEEPISEGAHDKEEPTSAGTLAEEVRSNGWVLAKGVPPNGGALVEEQPTSAGGPSEDIPTAGDLAVDGPTSGSLSVSSLMLMLAITFFVVLV